MWDVTSMPKEIGSFSDSETPAVSPDGEWLAVPLDSGAKLVNASAPERGTDLIANGDLGPSKWVFQTHKWYPTPSFSPDSKMILVKGLHRSWQEPFLGKWLPQQYNPFRADPGGTVVRVWDTESCRELLVLSDCTETWFSPDGRVLATIRDRQTIDLWKVPFRGSLRRILGWAVIVCLIVVSVGWVGVNTRRKLFSRQS